MKQKVFLLFFVFALISCEPDSVSMVDGFYENGIPQRINYYSSIDQTQLLKKELYYDSGQIKLTGSYKDNLKQGQWLYYFKDGAISNESWFFDGVLHGRSTSWYKNGKHRSNGYYQKGKRIRRWTFFDEKGRLLKKIDFSLE